MKDTTQATIALVVNLHQGVPVLAATLTNVNEILELELALASRDSDPLKRVDGFRKKQAGEDEEFADFVEGLLSQPFVKAEVQEHAVQWFKSRAKIESYQKAEDEASRVIAQYAFQIYATNPERTDFLLTGPKAKVRIRIFELNSEEQRNIA